MSAQTATGQDPTAGAVGLSGAAPFLAYGYRPRMAGAATRLTLDTGAAEPVLEWMVGPRSGRLPVKDITGLTLRYEPGQLGSANYALLIATRAGPSLRIGSVSRTGLTGVTDHRAGFVTFVTALHGALAATGAPVRYDAGLPVWRWRVMVALALVVGGALAWMAVSAVIAGLPIEAAIMVVLALVLAVPLAETLWRNVPGPYVPSAPPARLFPG